MKFRHSLGNRIALTLLIAGLVPVLAAHLWSGIDLARAVSILLFALLIIGLASLWLTRDIVVALRRLVADTERLARGELGHRAAINRRDEIGALAGAFNDMAQSLENSQARLLAAQEEMATHYRKLKEASERLDRLWEVSTSLTTTLELDQLLPQIGQAVTQLAQAPVAWVVLAKEHRGQPPRQALAFHPRLDPPHRETASLVLDHSLVNQVLETRSPMIFEDLTAPAAGSGYPGLERLCQTLEVRSLVVVPLTSGESTIGVLAYGRGGAGAPAEEERELVDILAGQATTAIENACLFEELRQLSDTDSLTRVYNHRYMMERLDAEIARARRYGHLLSVLLIDLDNFKMFNDSYGHLAGDTKLRQVAGALKAGCRASDVVGRYGGDEFIVILPETAPPEAEVVAQRVRGQLAPAVARELFSITASIGVATFPLDGADRQTLIARSDAALYYAKGQGGNQVYHSHPALSQPLSQPPDLDPLKRLMLVLDGRDDYLRSHTHRVFQYALALARRQRLPAEEQQALDIAARLHDIGRLGISPEIWNKPGPLTEAERRTVEQHPVLGAIVARQASEEEGILEAVRHHHERYDGAGYPSRLRGKAIPRLARLLAVVDAYAAMTALRPYRPAMSSEEAMAELRRGAGTQFDPEVVKGFTEMLAELEEASPQPSSAEAGQEKDQPGGQP